MFCWLVLVFTYHRMLAFPIPHPFWLGSAWFSWISHLCPTLIWMVFFWSKHLHAEQIQWVNFSILQGVFWFQCLYRQILLSIWQGLMCNNGWIGWLKLDFESNSRWFQNTTLWQYTSFQWQVRCLHEVVGIWPSLRSGWGSDQLT